VISEFLARNTTLLDNLGQKSGWIEIHNPTPNAVALDGWHLTNDAGNKTLWQFPDPTPDADLPLAPGGYLVVWASGADRAIVGQPLHTSFVLSTESGYLALIRPDGATVASAFAPTYARQMADVAYGWTADGRRLGYFTEPSPGMPNGNNANGSPEPVLISEIMYYAAHGQPGSVNYVPENSRQEYVELYNRSTTAVSLKDWQVDNWWFALEPIKPVAGISRSGWTATATLPGHDGAADFTSATMADDGLHGDGLAGDGMYGAALPAQPNNTVVEFYVSAGDAGALLRRWPAAPGLDGQAPAPTYANHTANLLYQVDNSFDPAAGNVATVVLTTLAGAAPHVTLADSGGNTLATGRTGPTNLSETISNFTTTATATFDLTVTADAGTDYSLTVIKNAAFDLGSEKGSDLFVCNLSIFSRSATGADRQIQSQSLAKAVYPTLITKRKPRLVAAANGRQLPFVRGLMDIGGPATQTSSLLDRQRLVALHPVQQRIALPQTMRPETAPGIVAGTLHHFRAQGIGFDVPKHGQHVLVVLDHRALEPPLPDVSPAAVKAVITLRMRNQQALHDTADRSAHRAQEEMDVVSHKAVAVQLKRLPLLQVSQGLEEGDIIPLLFEHRLAIVATVNHVVGQTIGNRSQRSRHAVILQHPRGPDKGKIVLTPFPPGCGGPD
jgi:hypothetical protein